MALIRSVGMKILLLVAAGCTLVFAGCERHPVAQLQQINERSEANQDKKQTAAAQEAGAPEPSASGSPRSYFPGSTK